MSELLPDEVRVWGWSDDLVQVSWGAKVEASRFAESVSAVSHGVVDLVRRTAELDAFGDEWLIEAGSVSRWTVNLEAATHRAETRSYQDDAVDVVPSVVEQLG